MHASRRNIIGYVLCIARAAVSQSVCEDSMAEFVMVIYKTKMGIAATLYNVYLELMVALWLVS